MKINYNILIGCLIISIGIVTHGYMMNSNNNEILNNKGHEANISSYKTVIDLTEVAGYLNLSEEQVMGIITTESTMLTKRGSFSGAMLPYFKVDKKYYFHKYGLDRWLEDVMLNKREYNTNSHIMLQ